MWILRPDWVDVDIAALIILIKDQIAALLVHTENHGNGHIDWVRRRPIFAPRIGVPKLMGLTAQVQRSAMLSKPEDRFFRFDTRPAAPRLAAAFRWLLHAQ